MAIYTLTGDCPECVTDKLERMKKRIRIKSASDPKPHPKYPKKYIIIVTT